MKRNQFIENTLTSLSNLTQLETYLSELYPASELVPKVFVPRLAEGAGITDSEAKELYRDLPSIDSILWTQYWFQKGEEFKLKNQKRAASLCYILAAQPRDGSPWKTRAYREQVAQFWSWVEDKHLNLYSHHFTTPEGKCHFYYHRPRSNRQPLKTIVFVNGLESAAEEMIFGSYHYFEKETALFFLSLPGSWDYERPMSTQSERVFQSFLNEIEGWDWVDERSIGMVGFSFGAYWTLITAKLDKRIRFAVCNGTPFDQSFLPMHAFGLNPIISRSLLAYFQSPSHVHLAPTILKLRQKALELLDKPSCPILALNGDNDRLVSPQDTEKLGNQAGNELVWIPQGEHCGLLRCKQMRREIYRWCLKHQ